MSGIPKLLFLNKMGMLVKATSDDSTSTPGYLYEEITNLTFGSSEQTAALLDFLVNRLEIRSCYVKLKVLNIMTHVVQKGHPDFAAGLRHKATGITKATMHSGPPHTLCDNAPYVAVRRAASELSAILFDTEKESMITSSKDVIDSEGNASKTTMEGFGNARKSNAQEKTFKDQIIKGFQQVKGSFSTVEDSHTGSVYKAMPIERNTSCASKSSMVLLKKTMNDAEKNPGVARISYKDGKAGGGWEDDGSCECNSSGHSIGSTPMSEKLQSAVVEDWNQEAKCVDDIVKNNEGRLIPSRQELDLLERRCSTLNCDQVLEFLMQKVVTEDNLIQMRALCAVERLLNTDLLGRDIEGTCGPLQVIISAQQTSKQSVSKAKKILRQLQSTNKQEMSLNTQTTQQPKVTSKSNSSTITEESANANLNPNSSSNCEQNNEFICSQNNSSLNNISKLENIFASLQNKHASDILIETREKATIDNKSPSTLNIEIESNCLPDTGESANKQNDLDVTSSINAGSGRSIKNDSIIYNLEDSDNLDTRGNQSKETPGRLTDKSNKSIKDSLLSNENNISDLLTSLNFNTDRIVNKKPKEKTSLNQIKGSVPPLKHQPVDKDSISAMFPQLSGSPLSGNSTVPLQLANQSAASFGFIASEETDTKPQKQQQKFDFVQEAMKSAITK